MVFGAVGFDRKARVMSSSISIDHRRFAAFLFDMDGTLLDSIAVANRIWGRWSERNGLDPIAVRQTMHGVRAIETVRRWRPDLDAEREAAAITRAEIEDVDGVVAIAGAAPFLRSIPEGRWAIVTSAPRSLAIRRLEAAGLPVPPVLVSADDVDRGKPAPDAYLTAAESLGVPAHACLVWEDAPAGIAAGTAAGAAIMVVTATHDHPVEAEYSVEDYRGLVVVEAEGGGLILSHQRHER